MHGQANIKMTKLIVTFRIARKMGKLQIKNICK